MLTLTCERAHELFSDAIEDSLSSTSRRGFELHLRTCVHCGAQFSDFRSALAALQTWNDESVPDSFHATLAARLSDLERRPSRRVAGLLVAAAALTGLVFAWPWLDRGRAPARLEIAALTAEPASEPEAAVHPVDLVRTELKSGRVPPVASARAPVALTIDTRPLVDLLSQAWSSLRSNPVRPALTKLAADTTEPPVLPDRATAIAAREPGPVPAAPPTIAASRSVEAEHSVESAAPVVVERTAGCVQIKTSGSPYEVIPALLALIAEGDQELRSAAAEHLTLMRDSFMEDRELAPQMTPLPDLDRHGSRSLAALRNDDRAAPANSTLQRWQQWWSDNRHLVDR